MTDTDSTPTTAESTDGSSTDEDPPSTRPEAITVLQWVGIAVFALFALLAGVGLYRSLGAIVNLWIADRYQPIANLLVNVAVLAVALSGLIVVLRRRTQGER